MENFKNIMKTPHCAILILIVSLFFLNIVCKYCITGYLSAKLKLLKLSYLEKFQDLKPSKIDYKMGEYDGINLSKYNTETESWKIKPDYPFYKNNLYTPQGNGVSLNSKISTYNLENGPSIDGLPDSKKSMFMFKQNKCSPECCPSTFSCDTGCICTTKNQRNFIASRGNNKTFFDNPEY